MIFKVWEQPRIVTPETIRKQYEAGFSGIQPDPRADEEMQSYGYSSVEDALTDLGYVGSSKGKLVLPYLAVTKNYPKAYPGPPQEIGDCVSHSNRNACLITLTNEAETGLPDSETGRVEECPEVSELGEIQGVLATEPQYNYRGHRSDGWYCAAAGNVVVKHTGAVLRKQYKTVDLTKYNPKFASKYWDANQIPREAYEEFNDNLFRDAAPVSDPQAIGDILIRGIGVSSCGSEGFSSERDENGWSRQVGSWAHAMAIIGSDDRPEIIRKYGETGYLVQNSWGPWNKGPRKILGTDIEIPEGCFWAPWSAIRKRQFIAIAGLNGWVRRLLPDWNLFS